MRGESRGRSWWFPVALIKGVGMKSTRCVSRRSSGRTTARSLFSNIVCKTGIVEKA